MKIIIAPAKKIKEDNFYRGDITIPIFSKETKQILKHLQTLNISQLQKILGCNAKIAKETYQTYKQLDLRDAYAPALLSYVGIQYTYMAPTIFTNKEYQYVQKHVRILSGFYGVLRPFDAISPYRLELNNPFKTNFCQSLYDFWQDKMYQEIILEDDIILDLASVQYSKIIKKYLTSNIQYTKCYFMEETPSGLKEKGVYVKMARGMMVRYLASMQATTIDEVKSFKELGYCYQESLSNDNSLVFTRKIEKRR